MKIVIDDKIPFIQGVLEPFAKVSYVNGASINNDMLKDADALIVRTRTICNRQLLHNTAVKFIATATIGFDHIDTRYCAENGIYWTNAQGCNSGSVYQYIAATLVFLARKHNFNFADRTLGVVGYGNVGKKVVRLAELFGMRVVVCDPPIVRKQGACGYISLDGIFREADIISLHVPLILDGQDKTHHLLNETNLTKVLPGTIIINTSRGEVIDNKSVKQALLQKKIEVAVLDVWENEPDIDPDLLSLLDIATPHIAGYSADGKANGTAMSVQSLSRFFNLSLSRWHPTNLVMPENATIELNCQGLSEQEILCRAIEQTYPIANDNAVLRHNFLEFEKYRGNYPLRREFAAYTLVLSNIAKPISVKLAHLGFKISEQSQILA